MRITGWHLVRLVREAQSDLVGGVVESIRLHPESGRLLIALSSKRGKALLVIGTRGTGQGLFWVHDKADLPALASFLATEKFNRLKRCRLVEVSLPQPDRVVRFSFQRHMPDSKEVSRFDLWVTWRGAAGNAWLVQPPDGTILESLWQSESVVKGTQFSPGPPPSLLNWQTITFPEYERERTSLKNLTPSEFVQKRLWGVDPVLAELILQVTSSATDQSEQLWEEFSLVLNLLRAATDPLTPIAIKGEHTESAAPVPVIASKIEEDREQFPTLAAALAALDAQSGDIDHRIRIVAELRRELQSRIRRLRHRIEETNRAIAKGQEAPQWRRCADLLGAQRHLLHPGMKDISIEDWESGSEVTIPLDPALRPQENIDALYDRASKLERAAANASQTLPDLVSTLKQLEAKLALLGDASTPIEELEAIRDWLGLKASGSHGQKTRTPKRLPYHEFQIGNAVVLVGRSSRDNDQLTMKIARPDDLFLHASHSGGAHVILRRESKSSEISGEVIVQAAQVAAFFSKGKHSHLVPVIYTEVRHVRKPRKAPAGLVQVTKEKSIMVRPLPPPGYHGAGYKE